MFVFSRMIKYISAEHHDMIAFVHLHELIDLNWFIFAAFQRWLKVYGFNSSRVKMTMNPSQGFL